MRRVFLWYNQRMLLTGKKTLLFLSAWFLFCAALYFAAVRARLFFALPLFLLLAGVFFVLFLLFNGGFLPLQKADGAEPPQMQGKRRANLFSLSPRRQAFWARLFLILFFPIVLVFFVDYVLILLQGLWVK